MPKSERKFKSYTYGDKFIRSDEVFSFVKFITYFMTIVWKWFTAEAPRTQRNLLFFVCRWDADKRKRSCLRQFVHKR